MADLLNGVKVVDLTYYVAGPGASKILADWGADVIKVEPPGGEPGRITGATLGLPTEDDCNPYFGTFNANKRDIIVNLKTEEGKEIMDHLLSQADVFVTSFRPRALTRLGLDYETVHERFPRIVWASINGFGEKGPDKDRPGFDTVAYWARSGAMLDLTEKDTAPVIPTLAFGDANTSGSLAGGICAALFSREKTGVGSKVLVSLFGQALWNLGPVVVSSQYGDIYPKTRKAPNEPMVNSYQTADGKWIFVSVFDDRLYPVFLEKVVGSEELASDSRYNNSVNAKEHTAELTQLIQDEFGKNTREEMIRRLQEADIAYEKINHVRDIIHDPQAEENDNIIRVHQRNGEDIYMAQPPVKVNGTEVKMRYGVPVPGEHTREVLQELGYGMEKIIHLENEKVVQTYDA